MAPVAALAPEPPAGERGVLHVALRLPHTRADRRFRPSEPLSAVFQYVDACLPADASRAYRLVTAYPRVVFARGAPLSLAQAGFASKTALIYEEVDE